MLLTFTVSRYFDKLDFSADLRLLWRSDDCWGGERLLNLRWCWTGGACLVVWLEASWWRRWCGWAFGWSRIFLRRFPKRRSRKCCTWSKCGNMSENRNNKKWVKQQWLPVVIPSHFSIVCSLHICSQWLSTSFRLTLTVILQGALRC